MTERPVHMHEQEAALASKDYAGHQLLTGRCGEDAARPFLGLLGRRGSWGGEGARGGQESFVCHSGRRLMHHHLGHHLDVRGEGMLGLSGSGGGNSLEGGV